MSVLCVLFYIFMSEKSMQFHDFMFCCIPLSFLQIRIDFFLQPIERVVK